MKALALFITLVLLAEFSFCQNITLSDNENYQAHNSAMVDVYSKTKGLLVPRLTNTEMYAIANPANGLIVYNSTQNNYYYWNGTGWSIVAVSEYFQSNGDTVFITGDGKRFGIGTNSPMGRLSVMGDSTATPDEPLFEVKNSEGQIIFAVYENEVQVNFVEDNTKAQKGGFAVGGLTSGKADPTEYMRITPDSVRIYIDDSSTKAQKGGFAVGGLTSGKALSNKYFILNSDSSRIYHKIGTKAQKGGFAVGGLTGGKAIPENYLTVERDSSRIYVNNETKGVKGGFAVGGLTSGKSGSVRFLSLTPDNYFIGDSAGLNTTTGIYNSFIGHQAGLENIEGSKNIFIGYQAGLNNVSGQENIYMGFKAGNTSEIGNWNTFLGFEAGLNNTGSDNTFIGYQAGRDHTNQGGNVYIGSKAGAESTQGEQNVYIGESTGLKTTTGKANVFIGFECGKLNTTGTKNVFMGYQSGVSNSDGSSNVFIGDSVGVSNQGGDKNIFIGNYAGQQNTYGNSNIYIGYQAGALENGGQNLFIGNYAGMNNTTSQNLFLGEYAGTKNTSGTRNTFVGFFAGSENQTGALNSYFGQFAGMDNVGDRNTMIGYWAGGDNTTGAHNTFLGWRAGQGSGTAANNVSLGYQAGEGATGSNNVFLGYQAGFYKGGSNMLVIGNSSSSELIYGEFDNEIIGLNGTVGIGTNTPDPNAKLDVKGNVYATSGDFYASSNSGVINLGGGYMSSFVNVISDSPPENGYANGDEDLYIEGDLEVDGNAYKPGGGSWSTQSDRRLKQDIRPYEDGLKKLLAINPVFFKYNQKAGVKTDKEFVGVIAQDVKDIIPYSVSLTPFERIEIEGEDGKVKEVLWKGESYYTFDPSALTYMLINAVKEQQSEIESLKSQLKDQQSLEDRIERLEKFITNK